jgi:hypothetical protein
MVAGHLSTGGWDQGTARLYGCESELKVFSTSENVVVSQSSVRCKELKQNHLSCEGKGNSEKL